MKITNEIIDAIKRPEAIVYQDFLSLTKKYIYIKKMEMYNMLSKKYNKNIRTIIRYIKKESQKKEVKK